MKRFAFVCACAFAVTVSAQPPAPKPGPEHDALKEMQGRWTGKMKMQGMESDCSVNYRMGLGGLWLMGDFQAKMGDQPFSGRSMDTYDPASKKYTGVWFDSMSTKPMTIEGTYDAGTKTMTCFGMGPGPDGKDVKHKMVTKMIDKDTMTFKMSMGDQEMFTIDYKRSADQPRRGKKPKDAPPPAK
jgi:hypothetical protein